MGRPRRRVVGGRGLGERPPRPEAEVPVPPVEAGRDLQRPGPHAQSLKSHWEAREGEAWDGAKETL